MIEKYGKSFNIRNIDRDLDTIRNMIKENKDFGRKKLIHINENQKFECRICHGYKGRDFIDVDGYKYLFCENCESIVMSNLPDVKSLYEDEGVSVEIYTDKERFYKRVEIIAMPKVQFIMDAIAEEFNLKNDVEKIWLDIGCGVGELLTAIKRLSKEEGLNYKPIGAETDKREIAVGKEFGLDIKEEFLDPENISTQMENLLSNARIVSLFNIVEHIVQPDKTIECLAKYMKKDSILVIEVPRYPSLAAFANITAPQHIYRHIIPPIHLQVFSEKGLELLFNDNFKIIAKWGFGQGYTDMLTNAMLNGKVEDGTLYNDLLNISNEVQKEIDAAGFSDQMIFIAKKVTS